MKVYEIKIKVFLLRNISKEIISMKLAHFIDSAMVKSGKLTDFHNENLIKGYVFDQLFPVEKEGVYLKDKIYTFRIRTVKQDLAEFFSEELVNNYTDDMKGLNCDIRLIPQKPLSVIYSITPAIVKTDEGYWKGNIKFNEFEDKLKNNLFKKYKEFTGEEIDENIDLYTSIRILNNTPCKFVYKDVCLLGDKIEIVPADNKLAYDIFYMAIGTGICENNSRGAGFVNYKYI